MKVDSGQFDWQICGHDRAVNFLQSTIKTGRIGQAYVFAGPANLGKYTVAERFIATLLCQAKADVKPCGQCFHCQQLAHGVHPDVYRLTRLVDEKTGKLRKKIIIDQVRDLKNRLSQASMLNDYKVGIIDKADELNTSAANALLKLLEEPTPRTVIILIADDASRLPATILSRCQQINFFPVATRLIEAFLTDRGVVEVRRVARLAYGRPGIAWSLVANQEQLDDHNTNISNFFLLARADLSQRFRLVDKLINFSGNEVFNSQLIGKIINDWQLVLRDLLLVASGNEYLVADIEQLDNLKQQSKNFDFFKINKLVKLINQAGIYFDYNISSRLILENIIINL